VRAGEFYRIIVDVTAALSWVSPRTFTGGGAKHARGLQLIVGAAQQSQVQRIVAPTPRKWLDVIDMEITRLRTSAAATIDERTAPTVAHVDRIAHTLGNIPRWPGGL
jgi:hypothetical protein